jgi:predicted HicB family RNase H-like nuclease
MKQSEKQPNKPKKQTAVSQLSLMVPRDIKVKLAREAKRNFRSLNQQVIFLLNGFSEPTAGNQK